MNNKKIFNKSDKCIKNIDHEYNNNGFSNKNSLNSLNIISKKKMISFKNNEKETASLFTSKSFYNSLFDSNTQQKSFLYFEETLFSYLISLRFNNLKISNFILFFIHLYWIIVYYSIGMFIFIHFYFFVKL
jgi:hypothetical protein